MNTPSARTVQINGKGCRIQEAGQGETLTYLHGPFGIPKWTPFLEALSESRRVLALSLPGFPGSENGHHDLDNLTDWVMATLDLLEAAGADGSDVMGSSIGAMIAAEIAATSRASVGRLILAAPYGLYLDEDPIDNLWAKRSNKMFPAAVDNVDGLKELLAAPAGLTNDDKVEWEIAQERAIVAGTRMCWPIAEFGLIKRLHRITQDTLIVWGANDRAIPPSYAKAFAAGITGPVTLETVADAGHLIDLDQPARLAEVVSSWLG